MPKGTYVPPKRPEYYRTYEENAPKTSNSFYNRKGKETQKESTTMMPSRNSTKTKAPVHSRLGNEKVSRDDSELEYIGVFKVYLVIHLLIHNIHS